MTCETFIIAWNEADIISLTIKHYQQFCQKVTIFDNYSTDNTREIAKSLGAEVKLFGIQGQLDDGEYLKVKNHCWKGSQADWVVVCDCDEILYNEDLSFILKQEIIYGTTIFRTRGFQIFSYDVPRETWLDLQTGVWRNDYSKSIIFSPRLQEIDYVYGCHEARPKGNIIHSRELLYVLHYHTIGGPERMIERHKLYAGRVSEKNRRWKMGAEYWEKTDQQKRKEWQNSYDESKTLREVGIISS